ncbi:MAG TPA: N-acetylmuramoyl-L-alanine amidase [Nitrospira sp.]
MPFNILILRTAAFSLLLILTSLCIPVQNGIVPSAQAAAQKDRPSQSSKSTKSGTSKIAVAPTSMIPATIKNLRSAISPDSTRLVLDLDRKTQAKKHIPAQPSGIVLEIPNATLSKAAQAKIAKGTLAEPFVITQTSAGTVAVALPHGSFETYKFMSLSNPPRLVIDVVPSQQQELAPPPEPTVPTDAAEIPAQPVIPRAKSYTTIVIDPGHGGKDPGAHGRRGTEEKDITLKVALKLRHLLSKQPGIRVLMTRERDVFVELEDRAKFANGNEADLFVSIHVNSHPQRSVRGIEIYHFGQAKDDRALEVAARENGTPLSSTGVGWEYLVADLLTAKKIEESLDLAWNAKEAMIAHMNGHYALVDHGVKTAPFYVLRFTSMPSILAEIAYISNAQEEQLLRTNAFTTRVAESLRDGVNAFLSASKPPAR